uniref:Transcriptional regulator n=1 Tax=Meloidogyne hapla TaxID=6305 RepID=A0A1I8AYK3_MELHA
MEKIKKEDDDIYLIRGILFFHTSELTTLQKMTAKTLFPDTKPLINEASFEKAISIFKKEFKIDGKDELKELKRN